MLRTIFATALGLAAPMLAGCTPFFYGGVVVFGPEGAGPAEPTE